MEYKPKIVENPSDKVVEFRCGGQLFIFQPKEKQLLDGFVAFHALFQIKAGLKDATAGEPSETSVGSLPAGKTNTFDFRQLSWRQLIQAAKGKGYKPGMNREQIYVLLEDKIK